MKSLTLLFLTIIITGLFSCGSNNNNIIDIASLKVTTRSQNVPQIYLLKKQLENSDFNYAKLDRRDDIVFDTLNRKNIMTIFEPVSGKYQYYQFISSFVGEAYHSDGPTLYRKFHDILIIKTDKDKKIMDAYQYTLEWAEPPLQYDMFKSTAKGITLINKLDIAQLKFMRTYGESENNKELKQSAILCLE